MKTLAILHCIFFALNLVNTVDVTKDGFSQQENPKNESDHTSTTESPVTENVLTSTIANLENEGAHTDRVTENEETSNNKDTLQAGETTVDDLGSRLVTWRGGGYIPPQVPFDYQNLNIFNPYPYYGGLQVYPVQVNPYYPRRSYNYHEQADYIGNYDIRLIGLH